MSESRSHIKLVAVAFNYIKSIVPENTVSLIQADSADLPRPSKVVGGFIPDVFFWDRDLLIIGEAKTINDFERNHSKDQYQAYIVECLSFHGKAILVISVPWQLVSTAKNYFCRLKSRMLCNIEIVILNEIGRSYVI